ncbi:hypothetical protein A2714_04725 [Candidatus Woesebacteria bacterium RIFCSPHIGHO2_01_FULL_38_9]|uniref:Uncharacterized protein n=2 Tax=Candidatus Woeseibacteriota TaxID=1752722 RepID=A0A1F7XZ53_9BACT|nr:MAG: hypothetical protein A2714_04725 [Candidatus Woesebacteria bacterium RIFCSPHIGHO2_01_FULL_38_9]OGM58850.1 MAG: hypothetical protein A3A75_06320 [Candidatus Woesebacteria bacterium RIFCSPLOWO2_01_FULL_39_10]
MDITKSIDYFKSLIDKNGIIQFTKGYKKDYSYGYAIEDQARALLVAILLEDRKLIDQFFNSIEESVTKDKGVDMLRDKFGKLTGNFDNFEEASAEVLWALSKLRNSKFGDSYKKSIDSVVLDLEKGLVKTPYPRVMAYTLLGLAELNNLKTVQLLANNLTNIYSKNKSEEWIWFESKMTYANALLPWSLFSAYSLLKKREYLVIAQKTLKFLFNNLTKEGVPIVVGNEGWWIKGKDMAFYDQQPIDISYMTLTCLSAKKITGKEKYLDKAKFYYSWFLGNNLKKQNMIREDGACYDGLYEYGPNPNAGAESNICFLIASLEMKNRGLLAT